MARARLRETIHDAATGRPIANAVVTVREQGTSNAIAATLYAAKTGPATISNPLTTGPDGAIVFWLDTAQQVDLLVVAAGYPDTTISDVPVIHDQTDLVTLTTAQTLTNKTLTSPSITSPSLSSPSITGQVMLQDGTVSNPALTWTGDLDNGPYRVGANEWSLVAGGQVAMHLRMAPKGHGAVGFGRIADLGVQPYWAWVSPDSIVKIHHVQQGATSGHVIGLHAEVQNDANSVGGSGVPDSSAITAVYYERAATAGGSFRVGEFQAFRDTAGADAVANATANVLELGMHNAGTRSLGAGGVYKIGIINSLATSANLSNPAKPIDYHLYLHGDLGQEDWILCNDESASALGLVWRLKHNGSQQALGTTSAPIYSFINDTDTGLGRAAADTLTGLAGGAEVWRATASAFWVKQALVESGVISPAILTANQNNYAPSGAGGARTIQLQSDASRTITGLSAGQSGQTGRLVRLINIGTQNIVLTHEDALSTDVNRFNTPTGTSFTLLPARTVELLWNGARWRLLLSS